VSSEMETEMERWYGLMFALLGAALIVVALAD
jgi:hypothetical protein